MVKKAKAAKKPRQKRLPGMQDAKIEALQQTALDYAEIRDQRQELTTQEVSLKDRLLKLMHKYKKENYVYQGVTVTLVHEDESVKVRIKHPEEAADLEVAVDPVEDGPEEVEEEDDVAEEEEVGEVEV